MQKKRHSKTDKFMNTKDYIQINIIDQYHHNKKIQLQVKYNIQMKIVKQLIHEKINEYQNSQNKIIGLQSIVQDPLLDYKLQKGIGYLTNNVDVRVLYQNFTFTGLNKYKLLKCLATGGFSKVYLARSLQNGQFLAAKFIDKLKVPSEDKKQLILNQKKVNQQTNYPFLVKMHEFIETDNFYIFIMDYCPGGELFYLLRSIKRMNEEQARIYFVEILLGIQYLHKQGIMYRDLKPQNIIIDQTGHVKIADFGLAKFYKKKSFSFCGSIEYMSPEIVTNSGHSFEVDYYCLGALLYELLIGCPPFYDPQLSQYQTKKNIAFCEVQFPQDYGLSQEVKDLIEKLLIKNPNLRLGHFGGAKQIMLHPWIGKINRNSIQEKCFKVPFVPDLSKFNFDPEQIGLSEQRFTHKIKHEYKIIHQRYNVNDNKIPSVQKKQSVNPNNITNKQRKQSLKNTKQREYSPYDSKKRHSNSCKKVQNINLNNNKSISSVNLLLKRSTNPFKKFRNIIKEIKQDIQDISNQNNNNKLSKSKCKSKCSLDKKKLTKKSGLDMYLPRKFQTVKTEFNENLGLGGSKTAACFKKRKQLTEQSQPFLFNEITNKNNILNTTNINNTTSLMNEKDLKRHFLYNYQLTETIKQQKYHLNNLNKNQGLKKSSNMKMKNNQNKSHMNINMENVNMKESNGFKFNKKERETAVL